MTFAITPPIKAADLFTLAPDGPIPGKPDFMNLKAVPHLRGRARPAELRGSGIYGVFLRDRLFYVGIYTGAGSTPFAGSVLDRWDKHLTYQTLRSPKVTFCRRALAEIVGMSGAPVEAIADATGGRGSSIAALVPEEHPLLASGGASCTANKARFALENWDIFGPGGEAQMLEEVTFVYGRLLPEPQVLALLEGSESDARYLWIKHKWLSVREGKLIEDLRPACNHQTDSDQARTDVTSAMFIDALHTQFSIDLRPLDEANSAIEIVAVQAQEDAASESEELPEYQPNEPRFRSRLSEAGETLVAELERAVPAAMQLGYTDTPDLRLYLEPRHRVLMRVETRSAGQLLIHSHASVATCAALGFVASSRADGWSSFPLDPDVADVATLLAIAGASLDFVTGGRG